MDITKSKHLGWGIYILFFLLVLFSFDSVMAQDVANGQATALVMAALQVVATSPLDFGNVYQGVAKSVSKNIADAGIFDILGQANADLLLYLSLPEYIATVSGDDRMTIAFSSSDCDIDTALVAQPGDPTSFVDGWQGVDPHNIMNVAGADPCLGDAGFSAIFIGGRVTPRVNQTSGAYSAAIILTVAYQGT
ncbi:MAG: hypothetical protein KAR42_02545 [candidate division Zixibacteria bacterium]|nr:hypothetical protein [candidate division Zixibacteria bacterium]